LITLNEIPGQQTPKKILLGSLNRGKVASTYLFYGDDGVGKWGMALALAALLNCEKPARDDDGKIVDSCGQCRNCRLIAGFNFTEMLFALPLPPHKNDKEYAELFLEFLQTKKAEPYQIVTGNRQLTIPIDAAREIKKKCAIRPAAGLKRVVLFYQMEKMLQASADSLLKLIEEPPPETVIVLTANSPGNLLPTIQSRSQKVRFAPVSQPEAVAYLTQRYGLPEEKAAVAARLGRGSIGKALNYISNPADSEQPETEDTADTAISFRQKSFLMFKGLFSKDTPAALDTIDNLLKSNDRGDAERVLEQWQSFLGDMICAKYDNPTGIINSDFAHDIDGFSAKIYDSDLIARLTEEIKLTVLGLRRNTHPRLALAALAIRMRRVINQSP
jgi:DNA polymerase-3 subunit delta'